MKVLATVSEVRKVEITKEDLSVAVLENLTAEDIGKLYKQKLTKNAKLKFGIPSWWYRNQAGDKWLENYSHGHYEGTLTKRALTNEEILTWAKIEKIVID